jgi:hypothetical protein
MVPVVTGTSALGVPLPIDFSMTDSPPASHNENYVYSSLQDSVEAHQLLLVKFVYFARSDFKGAHSAFRLMIARAVRRYGSCSAPSPMVSTD